MQLAQGHSLSPAGFTLVQSLADYMAAVLTYTAQDGLDDPLQLGGVFSFHELAQYCTFPHAGHACNLHWYFLPIATQCK